MQRKYLFRLLVTMFIAEFAGGATALAHGGRPHSTVELLKAWSWDPLVIIGLGLSGWAYGYGVRRLWRRSAIGESIREWEALAFLCGWLALFVALVSPLHRLGEMLFSAHMVQHEILMLIAAPLIVLGHPVIAFLWALPFGWRRKLGGMAKRRPVERTWKSLTHPLVAWALHGVALWVWHAPSLFQATLESDLVHTAQHLSFFLSALLFWWALVRGKRSLLGYGAAVLYVFSTAMHSGLLGALLTFTNKLWYPIYQDYTRSWGLTPIEDQQLGGLVMWIPAGMVYVVAGLLLFAAWLRAAERQALRRERRESTISLT